MTEWIGHFIANWPGWAIFIVIVAITIVWFFYMAFQAGPLFGRGHEWEEDRQKRIANQLEKNKAKVAMKVKKG